MKWTRAGSPILLCVVFVTMMLWTWGTWPDVIVDFGTG